VPVAQVRQATPFAFEDDRRAAHGEAGSAVAAGLAGLYGAEPRSLDDALERFARSSLTEIMTDYGA
jgi:hypothetical protein